MDPTLEIPVVVEHGAYMKAGFAGAALPKVWHNLVGRPRHQTPGSKECYIGDDQPRGVIMLRYPLTNGRIQNWVDMERIWHHTFYNELRIEPAEAAGMFSNSPLCTKEDKEKMLEVLFETFNIHSLSFQLHQTLAAFSTGRSTALVLDIGQYQSFCVPIHESSALLHAYKHRPGLGGRALTDYLVKLVNSNPSNGFQAITHRDQDIIIRDVKEQLASCQIPSDPIPDDQLPKSYQLPDGTYLDLDRERFLVPEALFSPSVLGIEGGGIHELVAEAVHDSPTHLISQLFSNLILTGGSTLFENIQTRLPQEIRNHLLKYYIPHPAEALRGDKNCLLGKIPKDICSFMTHTYLHDIQVVVPEHRRVAAWIGGSMLASSPEFKKWTTRKDYDEIGTKIVDKM